MSQNSHARVPELDGIRGIAILLVLFYHAFAFSMQNSAWSGIPHWVLIATGFGWAGVDLFFVLSGYLITGVLLRGVGKPNYFRNFYARRALRILPLYYLILILVAVIYSGSLGYVSVSFFYLSNMAPIFGVAASYPVLWSLAVEEHFYLIWPWLIARLKPHRIWLFAAMICFTEPAIRWMALSHGWVHSAPWEEYTWFNCDGLAAGALIALFAHSRWYSRERLYWIGLVCAVLAGMISAFCLAPGPVGSALVLSFFTLLFVGFVAVVVSGAVPPLTKLMCSRWLRRCGELSYFLYIIHWLVLDEWDWHVGKYPIFVVNSIGRFGSLCLRAFVVFAICFALAELSRRYFEGPILQFKRFFITQEGTDARRRGELIQPAGSLQASIREQPEAES